MPWRLCLLPVETSATGARGPKYFAWGEDPDPPALFDNTVPRAMIDYGFEPTALLAADVDATQITTLQALPDVTLIPANLDSQVGVNLVTVQAQLEALNLPADAVLAIHTYRQILRGVNAIIRVARRFAGIRGKTNGRLFPAGVTLTSAIGEFPIAAQQALLTAILELNYNVTDITVRPDPESPLVLDTSLSIRQVLNKLASQPTPAHLFGMEI